VSPGDPDRAGRIGYPPRCGRLPPPAAINGSSAVPVAVH